MAPGEAAQIGVVQDERVRDEAGHRRGGGVGRDGLLGGVCRGDGELQRLGGKGDGVGDEIKVVDGDGLEKLGGAILDRLEGGTLDLPAVVGGAAVGRGAEDERDVEGTGGGRVKQEQEEGEKGDGEDGAGGGHGVWWRWYLGGMNGGSEWRTRGAFVLQDRYSYGVVS